MKPLKLTLKNFGPYIDEVVDFTRFEESSLFLISGKTGSGKTTIFDGMSYALFGESSGKVRQGKELRSTFAEPSEPTEVQLLFSHGDFHYEVTRSPEQELYKKRGEGTRNQAAKISLVVKEADGKELKGYSKRREVDAFIQDLLHLDAAQFSQIVLLPQGDFRTFLLANSSDKEKVLRKLFGTQMYQALAEELKQRSAVKNQEINDTRKNIEGLLERVYWEPGQEVGELLTEQKLALLGDQLKRAQAGQQELARELEALKRERQELEQETFRIDEQERLEKRQQLLLEQQEEWLSKASEQQQQRTQEQQLLWVQQQEHLIASIDDLDSGLGDKQKQLRSILEDKEKAQAEVQELKNRNQQLQSRKEEMDTKQLEWNTLMNKMPLYEERDRLQKALAETDLRQLQQRVGDRQAQYSKLVEEQALILEGLKELPKLEREQLICAQQLKDWQTIAGDWQGLSEEKEQAQRNEQALEELTKHLEAAQHERQVAEDQLKDKRNQAIKLQIKRLSLLLEEGEPCPVCGSLEHPLQQHQETEVTLAQVQQAEQQQEQAEQQLRQQEERHTTLQLQRAHLMTQSQQLVAEIEQHGERIAEAVSDLLQTTVRIIDIDGEWLANQKAQLEGKASALATRIAELTQQEETQGTLSATLEELKQEVAELKESYQDEELKRQALTVKIETLQQQLDSSLSVDQVRERIESLKGQRNEWLQQTETLAQRLIQQEEALQQLTQQHVLLQQEVTSDQQALAAAQQKLDSAIRQSGQNYTLMELKELMKQVPQLTLLQQQISAYEDTGKGLRLQLDEVAKALTSAQLPPRSEVEEAHNALNETIKLKEDAFYFKKQKQEDNHKLYQEVREAVAAVDKKWDEVADLQQLAETINGNNPKKTSLERYVLQTYLKEVLAAANVRMAMLTNSRYQFELNSERNSYKSQTGLEINIYDDNAGASRSARTLSGGESFIAALALALSLAEVIQAQAGGVLIEALFVDEGFGSLDEEALEMAIEALETIENEGRMIGIISHVAELKSRIAQQMRIKTNGAGQSTVSYQVL